MIAYMIKVGIIGATGYAGAELVRLLLMRDDVEIVWYGSRSYIDKKFSDVFGNMVKLVDAKCMDDNMEELAEQADVIFTATPQGLCASLVNEEILKKTKIVDLSADFRIKDVEILNNEARIIGGPWEQSYESEDPYHDQVISDSSIYEFYKEKIPKHQNLKK